MFNVLEIGNLNLLKYYLYLTFPHIWNSDQITAKHLHVLGCRLSCSTENIYHLRDYLSLLIPAHIVQGFFSSLEYATFISCPVILKALPSIHIEPSQAAHQPCYILVSPWDGTQEKKGHTFPPYS